MPRIATLLALFLLALAVAGCAVAPASAPAPGRVAIVPSLVAAGASRSVEAQGKGASARDKGASGAASGALFGALAPPLTMGPVGIVAYPIIAPFTIVASAIAGGAYGAIQGSSLGLSESGALKARAMAEQAINEAVSSEPVAAEIASLAGARALPAELLPYSGPIERSEAPTYAFLRGRFDSVLEIGTPAVEITSPKGTPTRLAFRVSIHARCVGLSAGDCPARSFEWLGRPRSLGEWNAGGATMIRAEFELAQRELARTIFWSYFPDAGSAGERSR